MFVMTAKLDRKKILIGALTVLIVITAVILLIASGSRSSPASVPASIVKSNDDRLAFLRELGWEVEEEPVEVQSIVIPRTFEGVYESYSELQTEQGFHLAKYAGLEAVRYTYRIKNYPGVKDGVVADVIVYRNRVIAGDVQNTSLDGFMHGLKYPGT